MAILTGMRRLDLFVVAVHSPSYIWLFATPWTIAHQAPLSSTVSWTLLEFTSTKSVMLSNHLIFYCPLLLYLQSFLASGSFPMSWLFPSGGQNTGASASASVPPLNIQGWFPLGLTILISLLSKGLSRVIPSKLLHHSKAVIHEGGAIPGDTQKTQLTSHLLVLSHYQLIKRDLLFCWT